MSRNLLISLIITTYNRPDALAVVLHSLSAQTLPASEVLVADDGSGEDTARVVQAAAGNLSLRHVWQDDDGFRAGRARNLAVSQSSGDYLVFIDGDCVLRPNFLRCHADLAEAGQFVAGNRVLLSERFTAEVLAKALDLPAFSLADWWRHARAGDINRFLPLLELPGQAWRKRQPARWQGARTCNLAVWRRDFEAVNGFDEAFSGWGHEDADLAVRLLRSGVRRKDGRFGTAVLHLWHKENDRSHLPENERRLAEILAGTRVRAGQGLSGHRPA